MARSRKANQFCVDCGSKVVYYPTLSNPKAKNQNKVLTYACPECTKDFDKPKMFTIKRDEVEGLGDTIEVEITQPSTID